MRQQTSRALMWAIPAVVVALGVTACGGDDVTGGVDGSGGTGTGELVSVAKVDGADVLVDADGQVLYSTDVERGGSIKCVDQCTSFWAPLEATQAQAKDAATMWGEALSVVERPEGTSQLEYNGMPLYSFTSEGPGELTGDGFTDDFQGTRFVWEAAGVSSGSAAAGTGSPTEIDGGYGY